MPVERQSAYHLVQDDTSVFICLPPDSFAQSKDTKPAELPSIVSRRCCLGCAMAGSKPTPLVAIENSANIGCEFCTAAVSAAYKAFDKYWEDKQNLVSQNPKLTLRKTKVSWEGEDLRVTPPDTKLGGPRMEFVSGTAETTCPRLPPFVQNRRLISQPGSEEAIEAIQRWQLRCSNHAECPSTAETALPKRLLNVTKEGIVPDVVLEDTLEGQKGQYICLSYVWGEESQHTTNNNNLRQHKKCIPLSEFSKTVREAIEVTRRLGIRWLWVDALCIIQDDQSDWETEAGKMASIYEKSWLTLTATVSRGSTHGLFSPMTVPEQFRVDFPNEGEYSLSHAYCRARTHTLQCSVIRGLSGEGWYFAQLTSFGRSWTLQERLLSPRQLHFTREEMIWECRSAIICECRPDDNNSAGSSGNSGGGLKMRFYRQMNVRGGQPAPLEVWHQLVQRYFPCAITRPEDRLPAISGLARQFHEKNPALGTYLAGLWSSELPEGLLWWVKTEIILHDDDYNPIEFRSFGKHHGAPSWSWASVCGNTALASLRFAMDARQDTRSIQLVAEYFDDRLLYVPSGLDRFGQTAYGVLTLKAPFMAVRQGIQELISPDIDDEKGTKPMKKRYVDTITSLGSGVVLPSWQIRDQRCNDASSCNVGFTMDCWHSDSLAPRALSSGTIESLAPFRRELACAMIAESDIRCCSTEGGLVSVQKELLGGLQQPRDEFHSRILGLLLKPSRSGLDSYQRVGYFCAPNQFFSQSEIKVIKLV